MFDRKHIEDLAKSMRGEEPSRTLPPEILKDSLVPQVGNRLAFQQVETELKDSVFVLINLDDLGVLNDQYGHEHGDRVIRAVGVMLAKLSGTCEGQGFRLFGDTFLFCFPEQDQAIEFVHDSVNELKEFSAISAYGQASFACGIGEDMADAERALEVAKQAKRDNHGDAKVNLGAETGHGLCYVCPLGSMGAAPMDQESSDITEDYFTPKTTLPMELREEASPVEEGPEAEDRVQKSERAGVPDFVRQVPVDVP